MLTAHLYIYIYIIKIVDDEKKTWEYIPMILDIPESYPHHVSIYWG